MVQDFFYNLSSKFRKENLLSDITWCMCETSENFKKDFLKFFFPNENFDRVKVFEREYHYKDSRPDFYIETDNKIFIIEVKIGDNNHHFEQYTETFNIDKNQLGYIANYIIHKEGFEVKTWEQFDIYLQEKQSQIDNELEKEFYNCYLDYIKNVCSIVRITKKMNLENAYSLYCFTQTLKKVLDKNTETYSLKVDKQTIRDRYMGYYFEVTPKNEEKQKVRLWIGVYYDREKPEIWFEVDNVEGGGKPFYDILSSKNIKNDDPEDKKSHWFKVDSEEFNRKETVEEQELFLAKFIDDNLKIYFQ